MLPFNIFSIYHLSGRKTTLLFIGDTDTLKKCKMCLDEESGGGKEEQEQLDGMKFLGERDMKSLHKVIIEYLQCAIIDH